MIISADRLTKFTESIFEAAGATYDRAATVASHLVEANLKGHDSHGVGMIPTYVYGIKQGNLKIDSDAVVVQDKGAVLLVDGQYGFGQHVIKQAMQFGIARAKENGLVCVGCRDNFHIGRIGTYAEQCAAEGLISIHFVNVVGHPPYVAPWGGRDKRMQTNPFCCAVPTEGDPIVLDMATSAVALGKVRVAKSKGVPLPDGALFDAQGLPTNDPNAIDEGGSLGPFGMHKGYGLALVCELLGGGLAGEWTMQDVSKQKDMVVNHMLSFIVDPDLFGGVASFQREVQGMSEWLHSTTPAAGNDRVRLPGEPERESMADRLANGVPIDDVAWGLLCDAARTAGLTDEQIKALTS